MGSLSSVSTRTKNVVQTAPCLWSWRQTKSPYKLTQSTGKGLLTDYMNGVQVTLFQFLNLRMLFFEKGSVSRILHVLSQNILKRLFSTLHHWSTFMTRLPQRNVRKISVQSRPVRPSLLLKWTGIHAFLVCWGSYQISLPNQLRSLLKETNHENREEAILDLSRTLFFAGFRIWNKRQKLASRFWKDIAPENRSITHSYTKGKKKKKDNIAPSKCRNPFHFLRRYRNLSNIRENKCPCSKAPKETKEMPNQQITRFFHIPLIQIKSSSESMPIKSRTDKIRAQHDRGKKRKGYKLLNPKQRNKKTARHNKFR